MPELELPLWLLSFLWLWRPASACWLELRLLPEELPLTDTLSVALSGSADFAGGIAILTSHADIDLPGTASRRLELT